MNKKVAAMLIFSLAAILAAVLFSWAFVFSLVNPLIVLLMNVLVAGAFVLLFMKQKKGNKSLYAVATVVMLLGPLVYAYLYVAPFFSTALAVMYVLMHFVFAFGVVTVYTQWAKIKKLF